MAKTILPPATIGILGSGQLGRMLALVARQMGYRVAVYSPGSDTPTGHVADHEFTGAYDDLDAVRQFAESVDVVTYEFENVPAATAATVAEVVPLRPGAQVLKVAQNRIVEKTTLAEAGLPVTPFRPIHNLTDLKQAAADLGLPAVLKTATSGYDGKGQVKIDDSAEIEAAWTTLNTDSAVLEAFIDLDCEVSIVGARGVDGSFAHFDIIENVHRNHILDVSTAPNGAKLAAKDEVVRIAQGVFETLDVIGVLCVEFFITKQGAILINEIAPRPHNSGHLTIEACEASQFEQQLRAICGLPLGSTAYRAPTCMVNLLGDLWQGGEPDWAAALKQPNTHLHLYGKKEARIGRKMGHITVSAETIDEARRIALAARAALTKEKS